MDNFIESIVYFADKFLFDRRAIIIMHVDDPRVLKEILPKELLDEGLHEVACC
jgi:hypothetical protein